MCSEREVFGGGGGGCDHKKTLAGQVRPMAIGAERYTHFNSFGYSACKLSTTSGIMATNINKVLSGERFTTLHPVGQYIGAW